MPVLHLFVVCDSADNGDDDSGFFALVAAGVMWIVRRIFTVGKLSTQIRWEGS